MSKAKWKRSIRGAHQGVVTKIIKEVDEVLSQGGANGCRMIKSAECEVATAGVQA